MNDPSPKKLGRDLAGPTEQTLRRRRGRAIRKRRRFGTPAPPPEFVEAFKIMLDAVRGAWGQIQDTVKFIKQIFNSQPLLPRPLIHNGRKYRR